MDLEAVNLAEVTGLLRRQFASAPAEGFVNGRTLIRDVVGEHLGCSDAEAEVLVDIMVGRGFLRFEADTPTAGEAEAGMGDGRWVVGEPPDQPGDGRGKLGE